ncbi:MAG: hypothetical protein ABIH39_03270 [Candidatus Margulisiibacteriota bacterium]
MMITTVVITRNNFSNNLYKKNTWTNQDLQDVINEVGSPENITLAKVVELLKEVQDVNWSKKEEIPQKSAKYIYAVQVALHMLGYGEQVGKIDAVFQGKNANGERTKNTKNALSAYQKDQNKIGTNNSGNLTPQAIKALIASLKPLLTEKQKGESLPPVIITPSVPLTGSVIKSNKALLDIWKDNIGQGITLKEISPAANPEYKIGDTKIDYHMVLEYEVSVWENGQAINKTICEPHIIVQNNNGCRIMRWGNTNVVEQGWILSGYLEINDNMVQIKEGHKPQQVTGPVKEWGKPVFDQRNNKNSTENSGRKPMCFIGNLL